MQTELNRIEKRILDRIANETFVHDGCSDFVRIERILRDELEGMPRIYRGEEIKGFREGVMLWCIEEMEVVSIYQGRVRYFDGGEYQSGVEHFTYLGPLPTHQHNEPGQTDG